MTQRIVITFSRAKKSMTPANQRKVMRSIHAAAIKAGLEVEGVWYEGKGGQTIGQLTLEEFLQ